MTSSWKFMKKKKIFQTLTIYLAFRMRKTPPWSLYTKPRCRNSTSSPVAPSHECSELLIHYPELFCDVTYPVIDVTSRRGWNIFFECTGSVAEDEVRSPYWAGDGYMIGSRCHVARFGRPARMAVGILKDGLARPRRTEKSTRSRQSLTQRGIATGSGAS